MLDRDPIISSLTAIARQMRVNMALRELAWAACVISSTLLVYQILAAVIATPAVMSALTALLILLVVVSIGFFIARTIKPISLAQAAAATDARADLRDELKSSYWFARQQETSPLIDLQIQRAARVASELNPRKLFTIGFPRSAFAAVGLAVVAGLMAWIAPRAAYAPSPQANLTASAAIQASADSRKRQATAQTDRADEPRDMQNAAAENAATAAWTKLEAAVHSIGQGQELAAVAAAVKSRDAARVAQLLEELGRKREFAQAQSAGRASGIAAPASQDLLTRLQELFGGSNTPQPNASADEQLAIALSVAQKLEPDAKARENNPANHTADEATNNPLQAAVPLERYGPRETRRSENQGGEFGGTTDVEGGAMGRRVTQTTAGAGGKPSANETSDNNNIEAESAFGKSTMRLAAKLERMKIESKRSDSGDTQGASDGQFAATNAQQAQLDYRNAPQQTHYVRENAMSGERVPLAYRGAVKDYFLNLNRKEP